MGTPICTIPTAATEDTMQLITRSQSRITRERLPGFLPFYVVLRGEPWTTLSHGFTIEGLLQLPGLCSLCISRDVSASNR